jgi:hemoglobin-like flavoprotein
MGLKKSLKKRLSVKHGGSKRNANNNITPIVGEESPTPSSAKFSSDKPLVDEVKVPPHDLPRTINTRKKNNNERDEVRDQAILQVQESMKDLRPYQIRPLTKQDKVLVMQLWNKALAFSTGFSEALTIYWRLACCADHQGDPMTLVEKNEDPLYFCIRDRMVDAETLVMGLLDSAIRSLCPGHQKVQREAYRPIQHDVIVERANGEFSLECQSLEDHFALFARLGVTPDYWVKFIGACHWAMSSHTPYAQDDDMENLEHGPVHSALSRTIAIYVAIPAINTFKELATLYQAPVVLKIQELWETFSEYGRADFGEIFYRKLLSEHPQLIDYFLKTDMDALALHLSMALDMVIKNVNAMGVANTMFRTALENLAEMHRKNNVPTYSYALVGATILECFQPIFEKEEEATKDSDDPVIASDLRAGLTKVYSEIMSVVYYPMLKQEKLVTKAQEFYEQVKEELQWTDDQLHSRMMQIEEEIQMTGTYIQTTEELEMGARLAWRNSAKCVGRIAWDTLQIRDCRHISDPNDMFDEMREHLLAATAGTNIQSVMTVFKPKNPSELFGIRWWSAQLVRYAAYKNILTGEIVGDPANLELTGKYLLVQFWISVYSSLF